VKGKLVKIFRVILIFIGSLLALTVLGIVFLTEVKPWIYGKWFLGADTPQYIYYVIYYLKHPHFPVNGWDYLWHNGVPRILDLTWIHFTLNALLANSIGLYQSIKIYPLIFIALVIFFSYLLFLDLSGSVILALGLSVSLTIAGALYSDLFISGVVLSSISHAFLPMTLFFLVRFYKSRKKSYLVLGGVSAALGLYSHGLMGMFWVFIPSFLFVILATRSWRRLIDRESLGNAFLFGVTTLTVAAMASWPHIFQALKGGSNKSVFEKAEAMLYPSIFSNLIKFNDPGVIYAFIISILVALGFFIFRKRKPDRLLGALGGVLAFYLLWLGSYRVGINPLANVIFPGRIFWIWSVLLGAVTALLLRPLSQISGGKMIKVLAQIAGFSLIKLIILAVSMLGLAGYLTGAVHFKEAVKLEPIQELDIIDYHRQVNKDFLPLIDSADNNVRLWSHIPVINLTWKSNSDISLSEGYAHIFTKFSRGWEGWLFAVLAQPNWESQEIPREMAGQEAKFFIDWYGIKYLIGITDVGEYAVSPYFYQEGKDCISRSQSAQDGTTIFVVDQDFTSGVVSAVKVPVVGFVGANEGYANFLKNIAMLGFNTSHLIPVKISDSISGISSKKLTMVDALVIYDFEKRGLLYSHGWENVLDFVRAGGKAWIETGGNSGERENPHLPLIFPIAASQYGPLTENWQPGGEFASKIDFSSLKGLVFRDAPWKLSYASLSAVKPGARVLLTQKGYPVAVEQTVGKGKAVWTGLNTFYRPEEFRSNGMREVKLTEVFLESLMGPLSSKRVEAEVSRPAPENISIEGENFSGVVFKETNWPGWQARIEAGGKQEKLPILTAGPELMYLPIPKDLRTGKIKVFLNYRGAFVYWLSFFVSLISILLVICYLIFGKPIRKHILPRMKIFSPLRGMTKKITAWWGSEEE